MKWESQPNDKHTWAFYYFCKRKGDKVTVSFNKDNTINIEIHGYNND